MSNKTAVVTPLVMRQHKMIVEVEDGQMGGRWWSDVMPAREVRAFTAQMRKSGNFISDVDCVHTCWCVSERFENG